MIQSFLKKTPLYLKITFAISLIVFMISLTQPAFFIDRKNDPEAYSNSLFLFLLGWMSFLGGGLIPFIIWLANPLYFAAIILSTKNKKLSFLFSLAALLLALFFSLLNTILTSESGAESVITDRGLGFWLWFLSFIILSIGLLSNFAFNKKPIT